MSLLDTDCCCCCFCLSVLGGSRSWWAESWSACVLIISVCPELCLGCFSVSPIQLVQLKSADTLAPTVMKSVDPKSEVWFQGSLVKCCCFAGGGSSGDNMCVGHDMTDGSSSSTLLSQRKRAETLVHFRGSVCARRVNCH